MNFINFYHEELSDTKTNYFIFDTHSNKEWDIDFVKYSWETNKFNKVKQGDLFLYRRPKKSSENNLFYFFGIGKIEEIVRVPNNNNPTKVIAKISKPFPLPDYIYETDLSNFNWTYKTKNNNTWANFFNQYGMNQINKEDFLNLISTSNVNKELEDYNNEVAFEDRKKIDNNDYSAGNKSGKANIREGHSPYANDVKRNYSNKCAICSLSTRTFLVASHIVPWKDDEKNRLNPTNGICLCSFHDKAFDKGYITIDKNYKVQITDRKLKDDILENQLKEIRNKKISLPKVNKPGLQFLEYHIENIFNKFK